MAQAATLFDDPFIPVRDQAAIPLDEILPWAVLGTLIALSTLGSPRK